MRKIEDHKVKGGSLAKLAEQHFDEISKENRKTPQKAFEDIKDDLEVHVRIFLDHWLQKEKFHHLITADPEDLVKLVEEYEEKYCSEFNDKDRLAILEIFRYESFRKSKAAKTFATNLGLRACPYCNAQYIIATPKGLVCHFDHIYPKSIYPYLSLSFFNLVPCCAACNGRKSSNKPILNPYQDSFEEKFKFSTDSFDVVNTLLNGAKTAPWNDVEVKLEPVIGSSQCDLKKVEAQSETFDLENIYKQFSDVVQEIYLKKEYYSDSRKKELIEVCKGWFGGGNENEVVNRIILGNFAKIEDINQRPLAKFMQDIAKEAKLT